MKEQEGEKEKEKEEGKEEEEEEGRPQEVLVVPRTQSVNWISYSGKKRKHGISSNHEERPSSTNQRKTDLKFVCF